MFLVIHGLKGALRKYSSEHQPVNSCPETTASKNQQSTLPFSLKIEAELLKRPNFRKDKA